MLNWLWAMMIVVGVVYGACTGQMEAVSNGILEGGRDAVSLCVTMLGVVGMWCGVMEIAQKSGIVEGLTKAIEPAVRFLFPGIPKGHRALDEVSLNIVANVLGLGWAATPAGLRAMKALQELNERGRAGSDSGIASNEMCTFLILNISSLQLIPVNMIAYRAQYASESPAAIVGPGILATAVSTGVAVIFCKVMARK